MSHDEQRGPCGTEDCDECDPRPYWKVSWRRLVYVTHQRRIKASTQQEATAIYDQGTAHPSSYDDEYGQIVSEDPVTVVLCTVENDRRMEVDAEFARAGRGRNKCWNRKLTAADLAFLSNRPDLPDETSEPITPKDGQQHGQESEKP